MKLLQNLRRGKKGFTLIEIVIVLAIAALILVIVFLAVAGAQRSQKDNASLDAAGKAIAAYSSYLSDNNNTAPANVAAMASYTADIKDGRGKPLIDGVAGNTANIGTVTAPNPVFRLMPKGTCNATNDAFGSAGGDSNVAVVYWSENAKKTVCKQG